MITFKIDLNVFGGKNTCALLWHARLFCWRLYTIVSLNALVSDVPTLCCRRILWYAYIWMSKFKMFWLSARTPRIIIFAFVFRMSYVAVTSACCNVVPHMTRALEGADAFQFALQELGNDDNECWYYKLALWMDTVRMMIVQYRVLRYTPRRSQFRLTFYTIHYISIDADYMLSFDRSRWHVELTVYQTQHLKEDEWRHPVDCDRRTSTNQFIMVDMMNWFEHDCWDLIQSIQ